MDIQFVVKGAATLIKICIVDDEESIRDSLKLYLEEQGHEVKAFVNPLAMVEHCASCHLQDDPCFDVLFVDQSMAAMTGIDFLEHSHDICKLNPDCKFLMSGALNPQTILRANALGIRTLQKPVALNSIDRIVSLVARAKDSPLDDHGR
ncbi:MAG: hypothetical protein C0623_11205 [Desulfuromonas sp.]|nr:MAG: hypothetical protein C0623_11205 [Desulfuromonas sp.]